MLYRLILLLTLLFILVVSKSTIHDTKQLFWNTIRRWRVHIKNRQDFKERYNRLMKTKETVDQTTSGVILDSLNRFSVNNNKEQAALIAFSRYKTNTTLGAGWEREDSGSVQSSKSLSSYDFELRRSKRSVLVSETPESEFQYWEKELGMSTPQDQGSCGACWSFPAAAALEAVYRKLTGEFVVFSKQFLIDCTFPYDGCSGGTVTDGFKVTKYRQFLLSEKDWPTTADYTECKFTDQIASGEGNAMRKAWLSDWVPLPSSEQGLLEWLPTSPVAFASFISTNYYGYSSGLYDDTMCVWEPLPHAQLLVGYTRDYLRVRGSFGVIWGDNGHINYKRGSPNLANCKFFDHAYGITMSKRREVEYTFCNHARVVTRSKCLEWCRAMNVGGVSGWTLAVIPTQKHNQEILEMINSRFPGPKSEEKFNLLWIGLRDAQLNRTFGWTDSIMTSVLYSNFSTRHMGRGRYGLINKNTGHWTTKSSLTFEARGLCSRVVTCWDIGTAIERGSVMYDKSGELVDGTIATVRCERRCKLVGAARLVCSGGLWNGDDELPRCKCKKKGKKNKKRPRRHKERGSKERDTNNSSQLIVEVKIDSQQIKQ